MTGKEGEGEEAKDLGSKEGPFFSLLFISSFNQVECTYVRVVPFESVGLGIVRSLVKVLLEDSNT